MPRYCCGSRLLSGQFPHPDAFCFFLGVQGSHLAVEWPASPLLACPLVAGASSPTLCLDPHSCPHEEKGSPSHTVPAIPSTLVQTRAPLPPTAWSPASGRPPDPLCLTSEPSSLVPHPSHLLFSGSHLAHQPHVGPQVALCLGPLIHSHSQGGGWLADSQVWCWRVPVLIPYMPSLIVPLGCLRCFFHNRIVGAWADVWVTEKAPD